MSNNMIKQIGEKSAARLVVLFSELETEIQAAIISVTKQAQEDGKDSVKISLTHNIEIDLGSMRQKDKLSVSMKKTASIADGMDVEN